MKRYATYHLRWQLSAVVMAYPMMWISPEIGATKALFVCQFIGACIFFKIDKYILTKDFK
ncbi:MAG: hypothetical protein DRI61_17470 [Chloroflexi bacterium]|nr:MAG: hypothetical protein DRI61_17470 [Chloroflexota bacterium]